MYKEPTIDEKIRYCEEEIKSLYPEVKRNEMPHQYYVDLTDRLRQLKRELIEVEKPIQYVKK